MQASQENGESLTEMVLKIKRKLLDVEVLISTLEQTLVEKLYSDQVDSAIFLKSLSDLRIHLQFLKKRLYWQALLVLFKVHLLTLDTSEKYGKQTQRKRDC